MINEAIDLLAKKTNLSASLMQSVMEEIMSGKAQTPDIVSFLTLLNEKGETVDEITAAVGVMRRFSTKINSNHKLILDTCGTGGDRKGTFNVSTVVAFVASGCGIPVAKHGNRSVSSCCGSADILEDLGVDITMGKETAQKCLNEIGISFLFAPNFHPAMKYAMPARRQVAQRTIFNILGPLSNPANATHQLVGVFQKRWVEPLAKVLANLGSIHALVVYGEDGLDEITTTADTFVSEARKGEIKNYTISPEALGFKKSKAEDLLGGNVSDNAKIMLDILKGAKGAKRDIVVLNSAAAIYTADKAPSIKEGIGLACESIDSGEALKKLELLKKYSKGN
ncbi:MAG: anthranilate phosphoribosyltransferase [Candidatus Omnitrophica bacterium]|nr:anthranilate phosphoribosyltransferase [Candidatus Omnitrophota bacterium]